MRIVYPGLAVLARGLYPLSRIKIKPTTGDWYVVTMLVGVVLPMVLGVITGDYSILPDAYRVW